MASIFTVTTAASDRSLLTIGQLRDAVGAVDKTQDARLRDLGRRATGAIMRACCIRGAGVTPPTLRKESLAETFRLEHRTEKLVLSRRPILSIASITENGTALDASQFEIEAEAGIVHRLDAAGGRRPWAYNSGHLNFRAAITIALAYEAGWDIVPDELALAVSLLVKHLSDLAGQEANVQLEISDGFGRTGYFHGPNDQKLLPTNVAELLAPFKNQPF